MSTAFVSQLRAGRPAITLAEGAGTIAIRVEASDLWETVRVTAQPGMIVGEVKRRVVAELFPNAARDADFVLKFRGWEVLDERASLADAGLEDGSILLLAYRRRRAVK